VSLKPGLAVGLFGFWLAVLLSAAFLFFVFLFWGMVDVVTSC
jgi:hypothetical protein